MLTRGPGSNSSSISAPTPETAAAANTASRRTLLRAGFAHERDKVMSFQGEERAVSVHVLDAGPPDGGEPPSTHGP